MANGKKIVIELNNYHIKNAKLALAKKLMQDHPFLSHQKYAEMLGCSVRNLYRWFPKGEFPETFCKKGRPKQDVDYVIKKLEQAGYEVKKQEQQ